MMPGQSVDLRCGNSLEVLRQLADNSVDSIVCDPPYELTSSKSAKVGFMGKAWDGSGIAFNVDLWRECLRVLRPGGHCIAFGGTRTFHRTVCAIEDAGFQVRDLLAWLHSVGMPKSLNLRDEWEGWGTALKPAFEPILCAQKPLSDVPNSRTMMHIDNLIGNLICQSLSYARDAEKVLGLSHQGPNEAFDIAAELVSMMHGERFAELSARMDTFNSPEMVLTCLSIATLWRGILTASLNRGSMSTIGTITEAITHYRTLSLCISRIMRESIASREILRNGRTLNVTAAESYSLDASSGQVNTSENSAVEDVISNLAKEITLELAEAVEMLSWHRQAMIASSAQTYAQTGSITTQESSELSTPVNAAESNSRQSRQESPNTAEENVWRERSGRISNAPICVARKPLAKGYTVAANVHAHGTGALNIAGCRVGDEVRINPPASSMGLLDRASMPNTAGAKPREVTGRWPANTLHDGSDEVLAGFPVDKAGSAARFFYCAKPSKAERGEGNTHLTVKPVSLMKHLCRLVTPPGGLVLDPFMGSGTTGVAARMEGFRFMGVDLMPEHVAIAERRIAGAAPDLLGDAA